LKSLENDDKEICSFFYPDMFDTKTKQGQQLKMLKDEYEQGRIKMQSDYDFYNLVEKCLLEIEL
jgi:U3 small nucleolar ribonucleoprotein component